MKKYLIYMLTLSVFLTFNLAGCSPQEQTSREVLDKYFTSAQQQDYATTYTCYDSEYQKKVTKDEFISHRKEASVVQSYKVLQLDTQKDAAKATVEITFASSTKFKRTEPAIVKVNEDLIKQKDGWKIKV
ncbi:MAG TPA: hypothetical protein VIM51_13910 [Desulfosporosinus sp.]